MGLKRKLQLNYRKSRLNESKYKICSESRVRQLQVTCNVKRGRKVSMFSVAFIASFYRLHRHWSRIVENTETHFVLKRERKGRQEIILSVFKGNIVAKMTSNDGVHFLLLDKQLLAKSWPKSKENCRLLCWRQFYLWVNMAKQATLHSLHVSFFLVIGHLFRRK